MSKVEVCDLIWAEIGDIWDQYYRGDDLQEAYCSEVPDGVDDGLTCVLALSDYQLHICHLSNRKARTVTSVAVWDTKTDVCFTDRHEIIRTIAAHAYFPLSWTEGSLAEGEMLKGVVFLFFEAFDDKCFVLWGNSCEKFDGWW